MSKHIYSYLALGDSYTIGEGCALHESFPYQLVQILRNKSLHFHAPEILAKTGWTTAELAAHVLHTKLNTQYDFVTLAIGVNNQFKNLPVSDYKNDFEFLLKKALHFTGEQSSRVIVLSIPDWGATPFAQGKNSLKIASEIDTFNAVNHEISVSHKVHYVNINPGTREAGKNKLMIADDKLHYSAKEHLRWATEVADKMLQVIN